MLTGAKSRGAAVFERGGPLCARLQSLEVKELAAVRGVILTAAQCRPLE